MISYQLTRFGGPLERVESTPPPPAGTEVLLRVEACGVCHSDLHLQDGFFDMGGGRRLDLAKGRTLPLTPGHEIAGVAAALGPRAAGVEAGARYVAYPWIGCGECGVCGSEREHLCPRPRALGVTRAGGFGDHVLVPHPRYLFESGALPAALACTRACSGLTAYSALRKVEARVDGRPLVIVGLGGVGFAALRLAQATTDAAVVAVDVDDATLQAGAEAGAEVVDARAPDAARQVRRATGGGAAAVIDFVGSESSAALGLGALATGGLLVLVGLFGGELRAALPLWPLRDLTVRGSYVGSLAEMRELMRLAAAGQAPSIPVEPRPLADAQTALDDLRAGRAVGRIVLTP